MAYQSRFYVSVLLMTPDDRVVIFKIPTSTFGGSDSYWSAAYRILKQDQSPKDGASELISELTNLKLPRELFDVLNVISKPEEEYKCWMFVVRMTKKELSQLLKICKHPYSICSIEDVPHPQHWILNEYVDFILDNSSEN